MVSTSLPPCGVRYSACPLRRVHPCRRVADERVAQQPLTAKVAAEQLAGADAGGESGGALRRALHAAKGTTLRGAGATRRPLRTPARRASPYYLYIPVVARAGRTVGVEHLHQ